MTILLRHYEEEDGQGEYVIIVTDEKQVNYECQDDTIKGEVELPPFPGGYSTWPTNTPLYQHGERKIVGG